ncbi:hypothetical protein [Spirillospora sp. CA-294931]|uniref:hypothetical protein n=1 Tax=Spirillospora sp. CA-294931 TaxID=3240042 RepID=UPI003D8A9C40
MMQVDTFWSYALGSGFALAAAPQLRARATGRRTPGSIWANPYLTATVIFMSTLFVPMGVCLLWLAPGWETMYAGWKTMPAWLVGAAFALYGITAVAGFLVTERLLVRRRDRAAAASMALAYVAFWFTMLHGWDGTGYRRAFSVSHDRLLTWDDRQLLDRLGEVLTAPVGLSLLAMGVPFLGVLIFLVSRWRTQGRALEPDARHQSTVVVIGATSLLPLATALALSSFVRLVGWAPTLGLIAVLLVAAFVLPRHFKPEGAQPWTTP